MDRIFYRKRRSQRHGAACRTRGKLRTWCTRPAFIYSLPQVESFKLQVTMIRSPLIAKIKRTSVLVSAEKRLAEDLETMKNLVNILEKETDMLANYIPLADRTKGAKDGDDVKMESPVKENGGGHDAHVHRGSAAVQARLEKMLPPENEDVSPSSRVCLPSNARYHYIHLHSFCIAIACSIRRYVSELPSFCILLLLLLCSYRR
jgi:hypothetical protein